MTTRLTWIVCAVLFVTGCAVQTGSVNTENRYSAEKIDETTVRVTFEGNHQQGQEDVQQYLIYHCAVVTIRNGYSHFVVIADNSYKHVGKKEFLDSDLTFETTTSMSGGVNTRVRSNFGAQDVDVSYIGDFTIRMLKSAETHAVDAKTFKRDFESRN